MYNTLFAKMAAWLALNLLLLCLAGGAFVFFVLSGSSGGLLPAYWFSSNVDNSLRVISTNLQFRPTEEWAAILSTYNKPGAYTYHLVNLDTPYLYYSQEFLPHEVLEAAGRIPRILFTLCPDPQQVFNETYSAFQDQRIRDMEAGLPTTPPVLFMRHGLPASYWYGRALFVPDDEHNPHYVLLAIQSPSFTGDGLFFNFRYALFTLLGVIVVSCLWWWPFIWHIASPLLRMVGFAEDVASSTYAPRGETGTICPVPASRNDEIGRLGKALTAMTRKLTQQMTGQRQFIRHIAHELNTPLWRCKLGLAVLEERLDGDPRQRVQRALQELENLSQLTADVLAFLKAQSAPEPPQCQCLPLRPLLEGILRDEAPERNVRLEVDADVVIWADKDCVRRAVSNALRNALTYAGDADPVRIEARPETENQVVLTVCDSGPGVPPADLPTLFEPFFRSADAVLHHPGGSGLGLPIVKSSVEQCGGAASCANVEPHGFAVRMLFRTKKCPHEAEKREKP